jgi:uncharacterized Ntn-hydrolase superfamily protein
MTFSIAGFCPRTREFGCALATSSMAVGGRASFVAPGIGVVLSQARSDPRLGMLGLRRLEAGRSAREALSDMIASTPHSAWRQLGVLDLDGRVADFTGAQCAPATGACVGRGALAIGNGLANDAVVEAILRGFETAPEKPLTDRLLMALDPWSRCRRRARSTPLRGAKGGAAQRAFRAHRPQNRLFGYSHRRPSRSLDSLGAHGRRIRPEMPRPRERAAHGGDRAIRDEVTYGMLA